MSSASNPDVVAAVLRIPVQDLVHGTNARGVNLGDVTDLANSLTTLGQLQPVLVEPLDDGRWSVWDGNRRLKAAREAKVSHLLALPRKTPLDDVQRVLRQLGLQATNRAFDPMAEAEAIGRLMFDDDGPHMTREDIARALSKSSSWVKGRVDLLQLNPDEQESVRRGTMSVVNAHNTIAQRRFRAQPVTVSRTTPTMQASKRRQVPGDGPVDLHERHFVRTHPLGGLAVHRCTNIPSHHGRVFVGGVACGECWEAVIRADEAAKTRTEVLR